METSNDTRRRRILLADDDELILALLRRALEPHYDLLVGASGEAALDLLADPCHGVDIAVVDIGLPGIDGIELAGQLQEAHGIPCLFLSANEDCTKIRQAVQAGALGYLLKPIDMAKLLPAVTAALARADDLRRLRESESRLVQALQAGRETGLAVGILMERHRTDRETAFRLLRDHARSIRRRVDDVAAGIVEAAETLNSLNARFAEAARKAGRD